MIYFPYNNIRCIFVFYGSLTPVYFAKVSQEKKRMEMLLYVTTPLNYIVFLIYLCFIHIFNVIHICFLYIEEKNYHQNHRTAFL